MWNDGKTHMLEFGTIQSTIGFEGVKFLKIGSTNFKGLHEIALRPKGEDFARTISGPGA